MLPTALPRVKVFRKKMRIEQRSKKMIEIHHLAVVPFINILRPRREYLYYVASFLIKRLYILLVVENSTR